VKGRDQWFVRNLGDGAHEDSSLGAAQSDNRDSSARLLMAVECCSASLNSAVNEIRLPFRATVSAVLSRFGERASPQPTLFKAAIHRNLRAYKDHVYSICATFPCLRRRSLACARLSMDKRRNPDPLRARIPPYHVAHVRP
jgi:hypothetical protein